MKFLIRLDDACPTMDYVKWEKIENILDKHNIKPMVGIVPQNADEELNVVQESSAFWEMAYAWQSKGWAIALHGFDHCYISNEAGMNPLWNRSEFAGVSLDEQKKKIAKGLSILQSHGLYPTSFFAPSHTFDMNTLRALEEVSLIRIISDTIALKPYKKGNFIFIPQQFGHFIKPFINGFYTFCFHPNTMSEGAIIQFEKFISRYKELFIGFSDLDLSHLRNKSFLDRIISWLYFTKRKLRNIR